MSTTTPPRDATSAKPALQSVSIALGVLDALAAAPELSLSELARRVGVAKSTAHRTCAVLTAAGLLDPYAGREVPARAATDRVRASGDGALAGG